MPDDLQPQQPLPNNGPDPAAMAQMMSLTGGQGSPLPATSPVQGGDAGGGDPLQSSLVQSSDTGRQAFNTQLQRSQAQGDKAGPLIQQQGEASKDLSFSPSFKHGGGAGSFFHNLGQVLMTIGASTGPGRAIEDTVYAKRRGEYAGRAQEISDIQKQQQEEEQPLASAAGMVYHPIMAGASVERAHAATQNADTNAQRALDRHSEALTRLGQNFTKLDQGQQKLQLDTWYKGAYLDAFKARTDAGEEVGMAKVGALKDVATSIQSNKMINESPIKSMLMDMMGIMPDIQVPQGGSSVTTKPGQPNPQPKNKSGAAAAKSDPGAPARPGNVPANYVFRNGSKGKGWYKPGVN